MRAIVSHFTVVLPVFVCGLSAWVVCESACAGPADARTWEEDFDTDPRLNTADWQGRDGDPMGQFTVQDGMGIWDGSAGWQLVDSVDHYFNGETTIEMTFGSHPGIDDNGTLDDRGVGWFILAGNSSTMSDTTGMILASWSLARDADGQYLNPGATVDGEPLRIDVADGPVSTTVKVTVLGDSDGALMEYTVCDSNCVDLGEAPITGSYNMPNRTDFSEGAKGFTFTNFGNGMGSIDYLKVVNDPNPTTGPLLGDVNLDGVINGLDVDPFVGLVTGGTFQAEGDMNEDGVVNGLDVDPFVAAVVGGGTATVPEPSTMILAVCATLALVVFGSRRDR
jgi:hypothetical protein